MQYGLDSMQLSFNYFFRRLYKEFSFEYVSLEDSIDNIGDLRFPGLMLPQLCIENLGSLVFYDNAHSRNALYIISALFSKFFGLFDVFEYCCSTYLNSFRGLCNFYAVMLLDESFIF